jgi:hypothetical protein
MKRTPVLIVFVSLVLALSMVSCDAMFSNNLFGGMTHKKLSADSIQGQTPSELKDTLDSDYNRDQFAEDPQLRQAVLDQLAGSYDPGQGGNPGTSEGQVAAILAADLIIQTDPAAAGLVAGAMGIVTAGVPDVPDTEWFTDAVSGMLSQSVKEVFDAGGATPPQEFIDMIAAFEDASAAYYALNDGVGVDDAYDAGVESSEAAEIAVNALIAGLVETLQPTGGYTTVAEALWAAMLDPASADSFITVPGGDFEASMDDLTGDSGIGNLLGAAGLSF